MSSAKTTIYVMILCSFFVLIEVAKARAESVHGLVACLGAKGVKNYTSWGLGYDGDEKENEYFENLLRFSIQNLRYTESDVRKPSVIVLPQSKQEVQEAVTCCRQEGFEIRVRCGGHSYEGTSFTAEAPFAVIDLMNLNAVSVDAASATAWVDGGATLGEIYYAISQATGGYGFSAGSCPTIGSSGHIGGGGFGFLSRKYGLAADNVVDAELVDASGNLLDRKAMGENVFWAIRGGGGGSWGVVVAWKIKLIAIPPTVTVFIVSRRGFDNVTELVHKWQTVAPNLEEDFFLSVAVGANDGIFATFSGLYLGPRTEMLKSIDSRFPELGIEAEECREMTWIESVLFFSNLASGQDAAKLRDRNFTDKTFFYAKSDYVTEPMPKFAIEGAWRVLEEEPTEGYVIMDPYGGKMAEIPSSEIAFPHRAGNLFGIQYQVVWYKEDKGNELKYRGWLRKLYGYMTPFVSKNPRAAYVNYIDLDLGTMGLVNKGNAAVEMARKWGKKYFVGNFERLVQVKTRIDPENVFKNLQSIPPDYV